MSQSGTNIGSNLEPAPFVKRFAAQIARAANGFPIADVAAGSGRNANAFVGLGCSVICLDKDLSKLESQYHPDPIPVQIKAIKIDFLREAWPLGAASIGGIINVHFLLPALLPFFTQSLIPGGYLLIETVPGCGGNYLQLPKSNELRSSLSEGYDFEFYRERPVGPPGYQTVTARLLARRRT